MFKKEYRVSENADVSVMQKWVMDPTYWSSFGSLTDIDCDDNHCDAKVKLKKDHNIPADSLKNKFTYQISTEFNPDDLNPSLNSVGLKIVAFYHKS